MFFSCDPFHRRSEAILTNRGISIAPPQCPSSGSVALAAPKHQPSRLRQQDEEEEEEEEDDEDENENDKENSEENSHNATNESKYFANSCQLYVQCN